MSLVIDSHHHLLDPARIAYRILPHMPALDRKIGPEELEPLLEQAGVAATIIVQAEESVEETAYITELARATSWIAGVVGWLPLEDPERCGKLLEAARGGPLVGVRHGLYWEEDPRWIFREPVLESLALLAAENLAYDLTPLFPQHFEAVPMLAERLPSLRLVVDHMGWPRIAEEQWEPWASDFARAAEHPGCSVKFSGMDMALGEADAERFRRYADHALEHFGPERMLWGSNWPVSLMLRGYAELLDVARQLIAQCTSDEQDAILGSTARRVYGLELPAV